MRRPWIKIETATPDKPEICAIATRLRIDTDSVVGKLIRLWSWAEVNRVLWNDIGVTKEFIDKLVGRKGFADALEAAGWLSTLGETLQFPNFERHNGNASKIRGQTAKRVERHRQRKPSATRETPSKPIVDKLGETPAAEPVTYNDQEVINTVDSLIDNDSPVEFHTSLPPSEKTPELILSNEKIVTQEQVSLDPAALDPTAEESAEEAEASGKLPRLTKRPARLPADEDQPMLF